MNQVTYIISDIDKALAFEWIAERVDRSKFTLTFILILQEPSELQKFLNGHGISCHVLYYRSKKDFPGLLLKVFRLLRKVKPAIVHAHLLNASLIGLTAARLARVPKRIYTRHHSDFHHRYFPQGIKLDKWCNAMATHVVAPSGAVKNVLINKEHVDASKVLVIEHGFDLTYLHTIVPERICSLKAKHQTAGYFPVLGVISRFTELKGIQYIIPAFIRLLERYPRALIMFFNARGDYEAEILELLSSLPADNYRLVTFENDLASVYRLFDIFLQVSTDTTIESFGQTYVEALACEVPSVFTLAGIAPDFIQDGENALVVPFKNSDAIFSAILRILEDENLKDKLKRQGLLSVKDKFALETMIQNLQKLYAS